MSSLDKSLESKFNDLKLAINEDRGRLPTSQGVNALIMVYSPKEEKECLKRVKADYGDQYIIDLSKLFVNYIEEFGVDVFLEMYKNYRSTSVFYDDSDQQKDFLDLILREIKIAAENDKMPVLIRTGILYGTGIRNNVILESDEVAKMKKPLIVFYPGEVEKDIDGKERVYFLGTVKASDYRGQLL